jgi:hypothetical protein
MRQLFPILILLLFGFTINASFSQSSHFTVRESEKFTDSKRETRVLAVHTNDLNQTVVVRGLRRELMFEIFNEFVENTFYQIVPLTRRESFVGELFYGDEIKIFTVQRLDARSRVVYAHILNVATREYRKVKLFDTTVERGQNLILTSTKRQTYFALSPDEHYLTIATDHVNQKNNAYVIHVFDAKTLGLIYQKTYYEDPEKRFVLSSLAIENDGTVYSLGKEYQRGMGERRMGRANYEFVLCKVNEYGKEVMNIRPNDGAHLRTMKIANRRGEFSLIGFYSERNVNLIKGVSILQVDPDELTITSEQAFPLPLEVFEDLYGYDRAQRKRRRELRNFYLDYVLEDDFGNIYMLAEEFYITQTFVSNGNGVSIPIDEYHYDNILILKLNATGDLAWGRSIFKSASGPSYNAFLKDDQLHVLFNSGKKLRERADGRVKATKGFMEFTSALYDFIYEPNGDVLREKIQDNKIGYALYSPYRGNFRNGKFIMYSHSKNNRRMMILEGRSED